MSQFRIKRVEREIRRFVGEFISRGLKDPRIKGVSVTKVEVSKDLRWAWIYVSIFGVPKPEEVMSGLDRAKGYIRRELGREMRLRVVPELIFKEDRSIDYGFRIDQILSKVAIRHEGEDHIGDTEEDKGG
ncbi:MAG: 30S ribosome-binding factor RbfA [Synergistetes bacterium]|nr:30S ribosome-binding factor RbfA [Synergistota bacterium]